MRPPLSAWAALLRHPARFRFDAGLRVLMQRAHSADPAAAARYRSHPGMAHPSAEIAAVDAAAPDRPRVTLGLIGLIGAAGTLPRLYGTMTAAALRGRSAALHDFLDMLAQPLVAFFGRAGMKYRLHRSTEAAALARPPDPEPVAQALLSLTGHGTPAMAARLAAGTEPLLHYAGLFAMRPRSAERLAALLGDWLGEAVEVCQFAGAWLALPEDQRSALPRGIAPGAWSRLGVDAAIGVRSWDAQARIVLRIGPLGRAAFESLLPDQGGHARLASLVGAFLEGDTGFAINPVLRGAEVPQLQLGQQPRLGWNTWLEPAARPVLRPDAHQAVFERG